MTIVDLEQLPPDDRAAIQAMVDAAYRKAPELRAKLNDEAPSNAAHWHKVAMECRAEIDRLHVENARLAQEAKRLKGLLDAVHQIAGGACEAERDMRSVTPWFPVAVDPVHEGIYEVEYRQSRFLFRREWRDGVWAIPGAVLLPATRPKRWRGLTAPARTMPKDQR